MAIVATANAHADEAATPRSRDADAHGRLVGRAAKWLRARGCSIVLTELRCLTAEQPDAIGWRGSSGPSFLVEVKVSRSDFLRDREKPFRVNSARGVGEFRYFMAPVGLIRPDDLPQGWGLIEVDPKKENLVRGVDPKRCWGSTAAAFRHEFNATSERTMLLSALGRLHIGRTAAGVHEMLHATYPRPDVAAAKAHAEERRQACEAWAASLREGEQW